MGGREGLIDTAVKTAETGKFYIAEKKLYLVRFTIFVILFIRLHPKTFDKSYGIGNGLL